jgi:D-alanyl-lipoteichoic acid acyltransferase DltB (MBOAT superfamily)
MGPIVRAHDFVPQINKPYNVSEKDFAKGFYLIMSGMFKKLIISDYLTLNFVNYIFDDPSRYTGLENLFAIYAYAAVIYCDFSGYSDVAIGIAKWLGFHIPPNFLSPYQSKNIAEFWRRWHISLSSWLRDYLYIPMGGNRTASFATYFLSVIFFAGVYFSGFFLFHFSEFQSYILCTSLILLFILPSIFKGRSVTLTTNLNLMVTMLLGGFWHGASWTFILWGSMHGIALVIHKLWRAVTGNIFAKINNRYWYNAIAVIITFHFVCFSWVFFKAHDFATALAMLNQIWNDFGLNVWNAFFENYKNVLYMIMLAGLLHVIPDRTADLFLNRFPKIPVLLYIIVFFGFLLLYGTFKSAEQVLPIYLQF